MKSTLYESIDNDEFLTQFRGSFSGILRWQQFDELWSELHSGKTSGWYIYAPGEAPPVSPVSKQQFTGFLDEMDTLLRREHAEDYCGIVYVDAPLSPSFIKIYDPNNLGVVCGSSGNPPLPGWIVSRLQPVNLPNAIQPSARRKRWWRCLFG